MAWVKSKGGFYCDRCGASIWVDIRQERFVKMNPAPGPKAGDPHLSVSFAAFGEPGKGFNDGFMYCFDCTPVVVEALKALNKKPEG